MPISDKAAYKAAANSRRRLEKLLLLNDTDRKTRYKHPYETEILEAKYPNRVYEQAEPIPWQPVEGTEAIYVDTYEGVLKMLKDLKKAKEIAVDLEHHDFRTYVGLTSLMQISTREQDWIVDTLKPWRQQLQVLNEVFADPSIIKVSTAELTDAFSTKLTNLGFPRPIYGHGLAAARSWSVCQRSVRYWKCMRSATLPSKELGISSQEVCQL